MKQTLLFFLCFVLCLNLQAQGDNIVIDGVTFSADGKTLIKYSEGKTDTEYVIPEGTEVVGMEAFFGNTYLQQVSIPSSLIEIGDCAFRYCENLVTVVWGTYPKIIGKDIFGFNAVDDPPIQQFYIADNVSGYVLIDGILFSADGKKLLRAPIYNIGVESDVVPEGTEIIAKSAFEGVAMSDVVLPASLKLIEDNAFWVQERIPVRSNDYAEFRILTRVSCLASVPPVIVGNPFADPAWLNVNVPEESIEAYALAPEWDKFGTINGKHVSLENVTVENLKVKVEGNSVCLDSEKQISALKVFTPNGVLLFEKPVADKSYSFELDKSRKGVFFIEIYYEDATTEVFKLQK